MQLTLGEKQRNTKKTSADKFIVNKDICMRNIILACISNVRSGGGGGIDFFFLSYFSDVSKYVFLTLV